MYIFNIRGLTLNIDKTDSEHYSLIMIPMPPCPDLSPFAKELIMTVLSHTFLN